MAKSKYCEVWEIPTRTSTVANDRPSSVAVDLGRKILVWNAYRVPLQRCIVSTIVWTKSAATSVSSRIAEGRGHRGRRQAITAPSISSLLNRHGSVINKTRLNAVDNSLNFDAHTTFKAPSGVTPSEYLEWFGFVRMMLLQTVIEFRRCDS